MPHAVIQLTDLLLDLQSFSPSSFRGPLIGETNPELRRSRSLTDFDNFNSDDERSDQNTEM